MKLEQLCVNMGFLSDEKLMFSIVYLLSCENMTASVKEISRAYCEFKDDFIGKYRIIQKDLKKLENVGLAIQLRYGVFTLTEKVQKIGFLINEVSDVELKECGAKSQLGRKSHFTMHEETIPVYVIRNERKVIVAKVGNKAEALRTISRLTREYMDKKYGRDDKKMII